METKEMYYSVLSLSAIPVLLAQSQVKNVMASLRCNHRKILIFI